MKSDPSFVPSSGPSAAYAAIFNITGTGRSSILDSLSSTYYWMFPNQKKTANHLLLEQCFVKQPHKYPIKDEYGRNIDPVISLTDFNSATLAEVISQQDSSNDLFRVQAYMEIINEVALMIKENDKLNEMYSNHKYIVIWNTCPVVIIINAGCTNVLTGGETFDLLIDIGKYSHGKYH